MVRAFSHQLLLTELAQRGRLFTASEVAVIGADIGASKPSVRKAVDRLVKSRFLKRIERGIYLVDLPGLAPVHPFVVGSALTSDATISGWSALHHHGLTEQIPRIIEVTTSARVRFGERSPDGGRILAFESERFMFLTVVPKRMFGSDVVWFEQQRARVFDRERALLDVFIRPGAFGGIPTALSILEEHKEIIRADALIDHALRLSVASVASRVGWALEHVGAKVDVQRLLDVKASSYSLLDPSRAAAGPWRARWHLRENL